MRLRWLILLLLSSAAFAQHHNDLSWVAGVGGGTLSGFNVKKATISGGPYTTLQAVTGTVLTYSDSSNLVEGQHSFYVITATGPGGESAPSNQLDLTTPFSLPVKPTLSGAAF